MKRIVSFYSIVAIFLVDISNADVRLSVDKYEIEIGKSFKLRCEITEPQRRRSRQWIGGQDNGLLCFNGIVSDPQKYKETLEKDNTYILEILNVRESDLECPYACRYGFTSDELVLSVMNGYFDLISIPSGNSAVINYGHTNGSYIVNLKLSQVSPVPTCSINVKKNSEVHLVKQSEIKIGLLYNASYGIQSQLILHECKEPLRIECSSGNHTVDFDFPTNISAECNKSTEHKTQETITIVVSIVGIIVFIGGMSAICLHHFRRKQKKNTERCNYVPEKDPCLQIAMH